MNEAELSRVIAMLPFLSTGVVVAVLIALLSAVANVVFIIRTSQSQRRDVRVLVEAPTKHEFDIHVNQNLAEHAQLFSKVGGVERGLSAGIARLDRDLRDLLDRKFSEEAVRNDAGREKLHQRINRLSIGVAGLCARSGVAMPGEEEEK